MKKSRKNRQAKALGAPNIPCLETLEARQLLAVIDVGVTTALPLVTHDTTPALVGTVGDNTADVQVTLKQGLTAIGTWDATEDGSGGWEFTLPDPDALADGVYDILVTASANGGADSGEYSALAGLTIDATAPAVTVNPLTTNVISPELTGTVDDPAATVSVNVDGADYAAINNGDGTWTLAAGQIADLAEGTYNVTATATDEADNVGTDATTDELVIDLTAPVVTVDALATNVVSPGLTGTVDAIDATISVNVDGADYAAVNNGDGTWTLVVGQIADLAEGTYNVTATATDEAGNVGTDATTDELVIDLTAPVVTVDALATNVVSPGLTGTVDEIDATISVNVDGADYAAVNNGDGTWTLAAGQIADLAEGTYNVTVTATDEADNVGTDSTTDELVIDLTSPVVTVNALDANVRSPELTGTVDDPDATVSVNVDGADYAAVNNGDGTWALAAGQIADLADGTYDVTVTATDAAGNVGTDATVDELTVDATAPVVTIDSLATKVISPQLTGSVDDPTATVTVTVDGADYSAVNNGDGTWTLAAGQIADLAEGVYDVAVAATDGFGNVGTDASTDELVIDLTAPVATAATTATTSASPALAGTVDDPTAAITVTVRGSTYTAINNGDGTWSLPQGTISPLPNGLFQLTVTGTDTVGNVRTDSTAYVLVDSTGPVVTVDKIVTTDTTPALTGTVNDNAADIAVIVDGKTYDAVNNGDGTWTLPEDSVPALARGVHAVTVTATDALGNTGTADGVLSIGSADNVTLGMGVSSVTYVDADGTRVTITAGRGDVNVSFTGLNVSITGAGRTRTVTADGGVLNVAVAVVRDSKSLSVKTAKGGDGLATIHSITGAGILGTLKGGNLVLGGNGIDMLGRIQSINVYAIAADVVMNAATLPAKGVSIAAGIVRDCTIQTAYIRSLSVHSGSRNANVTATAITMLSVKGGFENSNVHAGTIGAATLYNVAADNGGVPFGLTSASLKKLTLKQGKTTLVWGKDFTGGIIDLFIHA